MLHESTPVVPPFRPLGQKPPSVAIETAADGCLLVRSTYVPAAGPRSISHMLAARASEHPDRTFIACRAPGHGAWRALSYAEADAGADAVAQWLLDRGLTNADSVLVLSENSIEHALMMLGAYSAGVPIAPVSSAYSFSVGRLDRLLSCFEKARPRVVFAQDARRYAPALEALLARDPSLTVVTVDGGTGIGFADVVATAPTPQVAMARESLSHLTVAKYLFTSGSTGMPKATVQTHGMFAAQIAGEDALKADSDTVIPKFLEWMPWSHVSAGNIVFHGVLSSGGTLYLDEGKPTRELFHVTMANLMEVSPTVFGSAPIAYAMLVDAMDHDPSLRRAFFKDMIRMGYGGASMADDVHRRLQSHAIAETGTRIPMVTMYGATETQAVTLVHWTTDRVGLIGLPLPGTTLKLCPCEEGFEVRVMGPTVSPGYVDDPERTSTAFDEHGFFKLQDVARFLDAANPTQGLLFAGRMDGRFKLASGTWVSVDFLRADVIAACEPHLQDVVITGPDRPFIGLLAWPSQHWQRRIEDDGRASEDTLRALLADLLAAYNCSAGGSSRRVARFVLLDSPPSAAHGEATAKGSVNQAEVIAHRADLCARLYADAPDDQIVQLP